ncbi:MAG: GTPase Era [Flaviflexus sp.]|uniref:GTPase Era n=1 Tax=Flaviflexus sp. TaxID=1969482 RepID=UPI00352E3E47
MTRAGFVSLVGRPNAGKSTLTNALVGDKVAITSARPQTTRRVIRGIVNRDGGQVIMVDTPGMHRPRTLLGQRLNDLVRDTLGDVDLVALCLPATDKVGPGDAFLLEEIKKSRTPVIALVTKTDLVSKEQLANHLIEVAEFYDFKEIVPVSAITGENVDYLADLLISMMEESPILYPEGETIHEPERIVVAELIREAALEGVRDELPHSIAVLVEEMNERPQKAGDKRPPLIDIHADLYVERSSQKGIVIGHKGARLKEVGKAAREEIEKLLACRVYLDIHVRVAKEWQRDPKLLRRLGF